MAQQLGMPPRLLVSPPPTPCSPADPKWGEDSPKGPWFLWGEEDLSSQEMKVRKGAACEAGLQLCSLSPLMGPELSPPGQARVGSPATRQCHTSLSPHYSALSRFSKLSQGLTKKSLLWV